MNRSPFKCFCGGYLKRPHPADVLVECRRCGADHLARDLRDAENQAVNAATTFGRQMTEDLAGKH